MKNLATIALAIVISVCVFAAGSNESYSNLTIVKDNNARYGLVNKTTGELIISPSYDYIGKFTEEGLAIYNFKGYFGLIDTKGAVLVAAKYDFIGNFVDGYARVSVNDKFGYINEQGEEVVPTIYDFATDFYGGVAEVVRDDKTILISLNEDLELL